MSNGNRNNVTEYGSDTGATESESRKAQEGDVEWIWETLGDVCLSCFLNEGVRTVLKVVWLHFKSITLNH